VLAQPYGPNLAGLGWVDKNPTNMASLFYVLGWPNHLGHTQLGWVRPTTTQKTWLLFYALGCTRPSHLGWVETGPTQLMS